MSTPSEGVFDQMREDDEPQPNGGGMDIVHAGDDGEPTRTTFAPPDKKEAVTTPTEPAKLPVWLDGVQTTKPTAAITQPRTAATTPTVHTTASHVIKAQPANNGVEGKWPKWQTLPQACDPRSVRPTVKMSFDEFALKEGTGQIDVLQVDRLDDLPEKYYTREMFSASKFTRIPQHVPGGKETAQSAQLFDKFNKEAPNSEVLFCFPWGVGVDNTIAGPMSKPATAEPGDESPLRKWSLYFSKFWYARPGDLRSISENKAEIIDVPGMVVQLSGCVLPTSLAYLACLRGSASCLGQEGAPAIKQTW
jgi:hypothetical protein